MSQGRPVMAGDAAQRRSLGFTLVELMVVVVLVAVIAAAAIYVYGRHINNSRRVEAESLIAKIQSLQEAYFERFGYYCNASGKTGVAAVANTSPPWYPALVAGGEPVAKSWNNPPAQFTNLGLTSVTNGAVYFSYVVVAGTLAASYALDGTAVALGVQSTGPWYYVIARGDLAKNDGVYSTFSATSYRPQVVVQNWGQ